MSLLLESTASDYDMKYMLASTHSYLHRICFLTCACLLSAAVALNCATMKAVSAPGAEKFGRYSPGIVTGNFLYVSGQGARRVDGSFSSDPAGQLRECLDKVEKIVSSAGFSLDGFVYAQVYVRDPAAFPDIDRAWTERFPHNGPARSMIGVANLPDATPILVSAVFFRDPAARKSVFVSNRANVVPDAVLTPDRAFLSDCRAPGSGDVTAEVRASMERMGTVLKAAGLDYRHMVFVNPYMLDSVAYGEMNAVYAKYFDFDDTPARATISVAALPDGARVEFTGVAVRDLHNRRSVRPKNMAPSPTASPCVFAGDTFYCSAKSGFIPGPHSGIYAATPETQLRQTMRNLLDGLEEAGLTFDNVVATNVYLDDIADAAKIDAISSSYFGGTPPAQTLVQQRPASERKTNSRDQWPTLEQISLVAVNGPVKFQLRANSPRFWELLSPDAKIETIASGFGFTEGPVWDERGFLYVSDEVTNKIFRLYPDGHHEDVVSLGDPDGNTYDKQHRLIDCASVLRAIIALQPDGKYSVLAGRYDGKRFNSPNDVVLGPDGALYFTDPTLDLPKGVKQELPFQGVYRLDRSGKVDLLIRDLAQPNGLAFSPDGRRLYVDDSERKDIHVYDVAPGGKVANGRLFAKMDPSGDPDGMRVDTAGNLYATGFGGIWIFNAGGDHLGTILLPEQTANLAWGDPDYSTLYITSSTSVLRLRTKATGFVPYK